MINMVLSELKKVPEGTDEKISLIDLRKSYLGFLNSLFSAEFEKIFTLEGIQT